MNATQSASSSLSPAIAVTGISAETSDGRSRWEVIQLFVQITRLLGAPRSVCEIFAFVFTAPQPITFEEIVSGLGISNGSASHGLRYLRRIGALSVTCFARDRRDFYVAETSLTRLVSGYLLENITLHLADNRERIAALRTALQTECSGDHLKNRAEILSDWNSQVAAAIAIASQALATQPKSAGYMETRSPQLEHSVGNDGCEALTSAPPSRNLSAGHSAIE